MRLWRRASLNLTAAAADTIPPPVGPPAPQIASPWTADPTGLELVTWAGLLDVIDLPATRAQAIAVPAVARGRDLICTTVARFPIWAMNSAGRLPVQPRICAQPEIGRARFTTLLWTVDTLLFYGVTWWLITSRYAEDGRPRTARWIPPDRIDTDEAGEIRSAYGRTVDPQRDVIRFDGPHEGLLTRGATAIRDARNLGSAYAKAARTPTPNVELHQTGGEPLGRTDITALIGDWAAARRGDNGGVAFTNQSVEAKMHGAQPEDLLIAGRGAARMDIAHQMGLPAWAVDAPTEGSSLTYSNVPARSRELIDYTLAGYIEAITTRLSLDDVLPAGTWAAASTDVLTDGDFGERMTAGQTAISAGIYTAEEMRTREAGVPLEGQTA